MFNEISTPVFGFVLAYYGERERLGFLLVGKKEPQVSIGNITEYELDLR